jgi:hypothetical protein
VTGWLCGGYTGAGITSEVWRLDLGELRAERMPSLTRGRAAHACCAVRGRVVLLGGVVDHGYITVAGKRRNEVTASVEILTFDSEAQVNIFKVLPPLSCGHLGQSVALAVDESESELGQVLLIGGEVGDEWSSQVHKVDLASGVCTPQPLLLGAPIIGCSAARLPDGRITCEVGLYVYCFP